MGLMEASSSDYWRLSARNKLNTKFNNDSVMRHTKLINDGVMRQTKLNNDV